MIAFNNVWYFIIVLLFADVIYPIIELQSNLSDGETAVGEDFYIECKVTNISTNSRFMIIWKYENKGKVVICEF